MFLFLLVFSIFLFLLCLNPGYLSIFFVTRVKYHTYKFLYLFLSLSLLFLSFFLFYFFPFCYSSYYYNILIPDLCVFNYRVSIQWLTVVHYVWRSSYLLLDYCFHIIYTKVFIYLYLVFFISSRHFYVYHIFQPFIAFFLYFRLFYHWFCYFIFFCYCLCLLMVYLVIGFILLLF